VYSAACSWLRRLAAAAEGFQTRLRRVFCDFA